MVKGATYGQDQISEGMKEDRKEPRKRYKIRFRGCGIIAQSKLPFRRWLQSLCNGCTHGAIRLEFQNFDPIAIRLEESIAGVGGVFDDVGSLSVAT
eukprot:g39582.t1